VRSKLKVLLYVSLSAGSLLLVAVVGLLVWGRQEQRLPSELIARQQFNSHRNEYIRFVRLLGQHPRARFIGSDGTAKTDAGNSQVVPEYRDLMRSIGAKFVEVGDDGSIEFALWGFGCAICSDSYMGVKYFPANQNAKSRSGWVPKLVKSLDSNELPQANGSIADGLYLVQLENGWYIYRLEYRE
jgi:hypothetical protein